MKLKTLPFSAVFYSFLLISFNIGCQEDREIEKSLNWVVCSGNQTDSTIYYVSPSGDDNNLGTHINKPFRTLRHGLQQVKPGGVVRVLPGTYHESVLLENCGDATATITIEGFNGIPALDGEQETAIGIFCEGCNNFIFRNLKIINYTDIGLGISGGDKIFITGLEVSENGHAVQLKDWELEGYGIHVELSHNVEIIDNEVFRNGPEPKIFPDYLMGTGINTYGNQNVTIKNNRSYDNIGGGILVEDSDDVLVEDNEVYGNDLDASEDEWWDGGLWLDGGGNVTIRNNYFHHNLGPGIEISDEDRQQPSGYCLENNISTENYYGIHIWNFGTTQWPDSSVINASGNQFMDNTVQDVWIVDWL